MTTDTDIANRAIMAIGGKTLANSLKADPDPAARCIRLIYDSTRDGLLRGAHWNFARIVRPLTLVKTASSGPFDPTTMPAPPWAFAYLQPSDCVAMRYVTADMGGEGVGLRPARYVLSVDEDKQGNKQRLVNTSVEHALGCYTQRIETPDFWDASFQQAMVHALAAQVAMAVTGNMQVAQAQRQMAMQTLQEARVSDGREGLIQTQRTPDWLLARGGGVDAEPQHTVGVSGWATPGFLLF